MAVRIMEGPPGGGKTYYIVWWLITNFCVQLKDGRWIIDPAKHVRVVSNIASLKIPHESFQAALDAAGGFETFFTKDYQAQFSRGWQIIYLLDEAQQWFRAKRCKLTNDSLLYFEWARHEGHDIWLITQHIKKIDFEVACIAEVVIRALPRTNNVASELTYSERTFEGTELESRRLIFDKDIAAQYKSENRKEAVRIRNPRVRRLVYALLVALLFIAGGLYKFSGVWRSLTHPELAKSSAAPSSKSSFGSAASPSSPVVPISSPAASALASVKSEPQVEYYMYRLDYAVSSSGVRFLLGIVWVPMKEFPYPLIKKGNSYFAMIPAVLLPALENGARALPIRIDKNKG